MRKVFFGVVWFLVLQSLVIVDLLHGKDSVVQKGELPRAFLQKLEGSATIRRDGESISVWSNRSTLEEILERIALEKKVELKFYCQDPGLKHERPANLKISAPSLEEALRKLLSGDYIFTSLNREGKPIKDWKDVATVNIYSKGCAGTDPPVRVFLAQREHPLLKVLPEEVSVDELREILKRGGPAFRRRAVDILGMQAGEEGIAYVREALKDDNLKVMFAAANALRRLGQKYGTEKVADAIYERFLEKPYAEFLPIMAEVDRNRIWPIVSGVMDQSGESEKGIIVRALFLTNDRRAIPYLSRISFAASMEISKQAIYVIGKMGGPEAATALMKLLREGDAQRQAWAAQAVFFLLKEDALNVRTEVEKIARKEKVADAFLGALAEVSYFEPLEKLIKDPASKAEPKIRALRALATKGTEGAIAVMSIGLNDKAPEVRLASAEAMGSLAVHSAIPYLIKAAQDKNAGVRKGAVRGLSEFAGNENVIEVLGKVVDDPDESVRKEAVDALALMGEPKEMFGKPNEVMIAVLIKCKNHKDPYVASKASSIWRHWGLE